MFDTFERIHIYEKIEKKRTKIVFEDVRTNFLWSNERNIRAIK